LSFSLFTTLLCVSISVYRRQRAKLIEALDQRRQLRAESGAFLGALPGSNYRSPRFRSPDL